ncbi:MAG: amidase [Burkholderiales bacterium]
MSESLATLDLCTASEALRRKELSSVDLTQACLDAIESSQARINAFISWTPEQALAVAQAADREIAAGGRRGPLHGIPIAWKDVLFREGHVTTAGSKILRGHVATRTATVLERLRNAGAVLVGALNLSEMIMSPTGRNVHYGDCRNPWNASRITGGSSSGSGAAVAGRLVPAALGSDTGGSVRIPAALCGVTGLKPTYGLVSRYGCMPRSWSLDVLGPLARSVKDCAVVTGAIAGWDGRDPSTSRRAAPDYEALATDPRKMRVGVPHAADHVHVEQGVRACLEASIRQLSELGIRIVEVRLPSFREYYDVATIVNKAEGSAIHAHWLRTRPRDYSPAVISRLEAGYHIPATHYLDALRARASLLRGFAREVLSKVDALHFPAVGVEAPTLEAVADDKPSEQPALVERLTFHTRWVNLLGLPALCLPCGFGPAGMPVGFQLIGRPFAEQTLFRIGHAYQQATSWHNYAPSPR